MIKLSDGSEIVSFTKRFDFGEGGLSGLDFIYRDWAIFENRAITSVNGSPCKHAKLSGKLDADPDVSVYTIPKVFSLASDSSHHCGWGCVDCFKEVFNETK